MPINIQIFLLLLNYKGYEKKDDAWKSIIEKLEMDDRETSAAVLYWGIG